MARALLMQRYASTPMMNQETQGRWDALDGRG
jgi:hypothetical protein